MKTVSLSKTEFAEKYMDVLQPLETCVVYYYRQNPNMHDHDVLHVYENLLKYVKARLTNYPLAPPKLEIISSELYLQQISILVSKENSYSFNELQECLKMLEKSVKLWNKAYGSRGYLNYISQFN